MHFRAHSFVERFRPLLAERKRGDVVDAPASSPTVAQICLSSGGNTGSTILLRRVGARLAQPIVHTVNDRNEIRTGPRLPSELQVMGFSPSRVFGQVIQGVVAAVDSPKVPDAKHEAPSCARPEIGKQKSAPPRRLFK